MKIILVSSDITYIPDDYRNVLEKVIKKNSKKIIGVILIKTNKTKLLKNILLLFFAGAKKISFVLMKNLIRNIFFSKKSFLKSYGVKVLEVNNVNDKKVLNFIKKEKINILFNMRSRSILKKEILKKTKVLNIHHGILPKNRGVFSDMRNLVNGDELGFSIHEINEKIDDGDILKIKKINYKKDKKYLSYLEFTSEIEADFLADFIFNFDGKYKLMINLNKEENIFYKNPNFKEIKEMKKNGLVI